MTTESLLRNRNRNGLLFLIILLAKAAPFDLSVAARAQDSGPPFRSCNQLTSEFSIRFLAFDPWPKEPIKAFGNKPLEDWSDDDVEYTRQQIGDCLAQGRLRQNEATQYRAALESLVPKILKARAGLAQRRQEKEAQALQEQQRTAETHAAEQADSMAKLRQVATQLQSYPLEGVTDLSAALRVLNQLKATADAARMKIDSTVVEDDRAAFAIQLSVNDRIEAYRKLQSVRESERCAASLRSAGLPQAWLQKDVQLAFSTGYQEPLVLLLCAWTQRGVTVRYSAGIPLLSDPSLTIKKLGSDEIMLSLSERHQNGVTFIVPTAYAGPEGTISAQNQRDLQQIYALLMQVGR